MIISEKREAGFFLIGLGIAMGGAAMFLFILNLYGYSKDAFTIFGKLIAIGIIILGISIIITAIKFNQAEELKFEIKNNKLIFESRVYNLENSFLIVDFEKDKDYDGKYRVTLKLEKKDNLKTIFEKIVLNEDEMKEFLRLIKPYRKSDICLLEDKENKIIRYFKGGFVFENRDILYKDIKWFKTEITQINGPRYLDVEIGLKNGDIISKRLNGSKKEYAQVIYTQMIYENGGKKPQVICKEYKEAKYTGYLFGLNIILFILFIILQSPIMMFIFFGSTIITYLYTSYYDKKYPTRLCHAIKDFSKTVKI